MDDFASDAVADYIPLTVGKYITYHVDSLVFTNFQREREIHSYQVKHVVAAQVTDNQGRLSYRIERYIRDAAGINPWAVNGNYMITVFDDRAEVIEYNLRFLRLLAPIKTGFSWKANKYLPSDPFESLGYSFSNDNGIKDWESTYTGINESIVLNQKPVNDVISILEIDEYNIPDTIAIINNKAIIPDSPNLSNSIWVRGLATDTVDVVMPKNDAWKKITLANSTAQALLLDTIYTPAGLSRNYEYGIKNWTFGKNRDGDIVDTAVLVGPTYASRFLCTEKYAKKIGLVAREYELWEFQPNLASTPTYAGFGIRMWMIDHN
jgi:hypothetical protein